MNAHMFLVCVCWTWYIVSGIRKFDEHNIDDNCECDHHHCDGDDDANVCFCLHSMRYTVGFAPFGCFIWALTTYILLQFWFSLYTSFVFFWFSFCVCWASNGCCCCCCCHCHRFDGFLLFLKVHSSNGETCFSKLKLKHNPVGALKQPKSIRNWRFTDCWVSHQSEWLCITQEKEEIILTVWTVVLSLYCDYKYTSTMCQWPTNEPNKQKWKCKKNEKQSAKGNAIILVLQSTNTITVWNVCVFCSYFAVFNPIRSIYE